MTPAKPRFDLRGRHTFSLPSLTCTRVKDNHNNNQIYFCVKAAIFWWYFDSQSSDILESFWCKFQWYFDVRAAIFSKTVMSDGQIRDTLMSQQQYFSSIFMLKQRYFDVRATIFLWSNRRYLCCILMSEQRCFSNILMSELRYFRDLLFMVKSDIFW